MNKYFLLLLATLVLSSACSGKNNTGNETTLPDDSINTIVVMPVSHPHSPKDGPMEGMLNKGDYVLTGLIATYFKDQEKVRIVSEDQFSTMGINHKDSLIRQSYDVGQQLKSDAVLLVTLSRYLERDGGDYSINHPASVAFEYRLLHPETQSIICSGVFDETQESFTDNILSFKSLFNRGFKWISTKQLAKEGIESKLSECRYLNPPPK